MPTPSLTTLFEESCDPHGYIPRRASEEVLRCLAQLIRDGEPAVVLHGPSGIGKTMLLRVLAERFADERRVAYLPLTDAPAPELTHRVLDELSEATTEDPAAALVQAASTASRGEPRLLVLVDHANLAPIASSLQLVSAAQSAAPHLTVIFAVADEVGADEFARAIAANARVTTLSFSQSMDPSEATAYVRLRLARADVPTAVRERLDDRAVAWLSEGAQAALPREINRRASELLRSYEEDGEAALSVRIEHEDARPPEPAPPAPGEPRAIDPAGMPRDDAVEPNPPAFPMQPGGAAQGSGTGSLGGMLLGSGPGPKPNFEIDLELGRSLSSGLLESQRPKPAAQPQSVVRDGQPVPPPPTTPKGDPVEAPPPAAHPSTDTNRPVVAIAASITALLMLGGFLAMQSSIETEPVEFEEQAVPPVALDPIAPPAPRPAIPDVVEPPPTTANVVTRRAATPPPSTTPTPSEVATTPEPPSSPRATTTPPSRGGARPSLVAGPMPDPVIALETERAAAAEPPPPPPPRQPAPVAKRAPAAKRPKGPLILQSGDSAEISNPGSYARLTIDVEEGAEIFVDGKSIGRAPFDEIMVEMGTHTFVANLPDGLVIEQLVDVQIGTDVVEF